MNASPLSIAIAASFLSLASVGSGSAAPVGEVIRACDNMHAAGQTCNYGIKGNSLVGCTDTIVFECPADGSRQCTGSKNPTGKCNENGTARIVPMRGDDLLGELSTTRSAAPAKVQ